MAQTPHLGIPIIEQASASKEVVINDGFLIVDNLASRIHLTGLVADRPTAGWPGRLYFAQDAPRTLYEDNGTAWVALFVEGSAGGLSAHSHTGTGDGGELSSPVIATQAVLRGQTAAPGTPPSGKAYLYVKTDGKVYLKNDAGTEFDLTATGGGGAGPALLYSGTTEPTEPTWEFAGAGVSVANDGTNNKNVITIPGGGAGAADTLAADLADAATLAKGDAKIGFHQANAAGMLTGAADRTVHQKLGERLSVLDFTGADPTGAADSYAAFAAMIAAMGTTGRRGYVPQGVYRLSAALHLTKQLILEGESGAGWAPGSKLLFDAGVAGIVVDYGTPDGQWSVIRDLAVMAAGKTTAVHGITLSGRALIENCYVANWKGDGIHIVANSGGTPASNANLWEIRNCYVNANDGHGLFLDGTDANAGRALGLSCDNNGGWGIFDSSFLGNTYLGCHTAANGLGAYKANELNARCVFLGCYSEAGQPASDISYPSIVLGGTHGAGFAATTTAPFLDSDASRSFMVRNALGAWNTRGTKAVKGWLGKDDTTQTALGFEAPGDSEFYGFRWEATDTGWWDLIRNNLAANNPIAISGAAATVGAGQVRFNNGYYLMGGALMRYRGIGSAAPTSGTWRQGDVIWNSAPTATGTAAWVCTTAGTPGTWTALSLAPSGSANPFTTITRTLPTVVNDEVDIGTFAGPNGAGALWVSVVVDSTGFSVAKEYLVPVQFGTIGWQRVRPVAATGAYSGQDFELDISITNANALLRLRRTAGATAATATVIFRYDAASGATFTASTATSSVSAPTSDYGPTASGGTPWTRSAGGILYPTTTGDKVAIGDIGTTLHDLYIKRSGGTGTDAAPHAGVWVDSTILDGDIDAGGGPDIGPLNGRVSYLNTTASPSDLVSTGIDSRYVYGDATHAAQGTCHGFTFVGDVVRSSSNSNEFAGLMGYVRLRNGTPGSIWTTDLSAHGPIGTQPGALMGGVHLVNQYYNGSPSRCESALGIFVTRQGAGAGAETGHSTATTYALDNGLIVTGSITGGGVAVKKGIRIGGDSASPWFGPGQGPANIGVGLWIQDLSQRAIQIVGPNSSIAFGLDTDSIQGVLDRVSGGWMQFSSVGLRVTNALATNDPILDLGSANASQSNSIWLRNGTGTLKLFVAGGAGSFLTPTTAGDVGLITPAGKACYLAVGTAQIASVNASGFDLWNIAAPTNPATGSVRFYSKSDNNVYVRDPTGRETNLTSGAVGAPIILSRVLPVVIGQEVDIGSWAFTNGAGALWVSITVNSAGFAVAKEFVIPAQPLVSAGDTGWQRVRPIADTGAYNGQDFALDVRINGTTVSLRLYRGTGMGGAAGTANVWIWQTGVQGDVFTASTASAGAVATTTPYIPLGGQAMPMLAGSLPWPQTTIAAGQMVPLDLTVTGATVGDVAIVSLDSLTTANLGADGLAITNSVEMVYPSVSGAAQVTTGVRNISGVAQTVPAGMIRASVVKVA